MHLKDDDLILRYYGELDGAPESRATEHLAELMMDAALKGALASRRADEIMEK